MIEQFCTVGDVEICYETFGEPGRPALLLIIGLGMQMIVWHDDFCRMLADRGFFVIRYDNRDVGRSTRFDGVPPPARLGLLRRRPRRFAYTLADMAGDGAGVLAHLGIEAAHVVGASMGGMIAQDLAARHPRRVLSLVSMMSSTGSRWAGQPALRAYPYFLRDFLRAPPASKEEYVDRAVRFYRLIGSPAFDRDEQALLRDMVALSFERGWSPAGTARQMAAVMAAGNRSADLGRIKAPTLVIHGTADPLAAPSGGRATARAIPGARLMLLEGMGHVVPRRWWPRVVGAIADNAARAPDLDARQP